MLIIKKPNISVLGQRARLSAEILEDGQSKTLWFEVDANYQSGLNDRSDAFVIGLLYWAMVYHHDIRCEAPISERLHFQITRNLCPFLQKWSTRMIAPKIEAPLIAEPLETQGAVGAGCSGGIDSFNVIARHLNPVYASLKLTHLSHFSVGHMYEHTDNPETMQLIAASEHRIATIAKEVGLNFVPVRSNYNDILPHTILYTSTYCDMACVHALGKLFGTFFYASGGDRAFTYKNAECIAASDYNLISLPNLSTPTLMLYSEGENLMRIEKTRTVATLPSARKHLNVCCQELRYCGASDGVSNRNCGVCDKCLLTLLDLDALGLLDAFRDVFDIEAYRHNHRNALRFLLKHHLNNDEFEKVAWQHFKHEIRLSDWFAERKVVFRKIRNFLRYSVLKLSPRVPRFKDPRISKTHEER